MFSYLPQDCLARLETIAVRIAERLICFLHWARHNRNRADQLLLMRDTWVE